MAYRTRLFEWAQREGLTVPELAELTGYSARHLYRIRDGYYPVNERFAARVTYKLGDWARTLFFVPTVSEAADKAAHKADKGVAA